MPLQKASEYMKRFIDELEMRNKSNSNSGHTSKRVSLEERKKSEVTLRNWLIKMAMGGDDDSVKIQSYYFNVSDLLFSKNNAINLFVDWDNEVDPGDESSVREGLNEQLEAVTVKEAIEEVLGRNNYSRIEDALLNGKDIPKKAQAFEVAEAVLPLLLALRSSGMVEKHPDQAGFMVKTWSAKLRNVLEQADQKYFDEKLKDLGSPTA
jgi:hypothetical protein